MIKLLDMEKKYQRIKQDYYTEHFHCLYIVKTIRNFFFKKEALKNTIPVVNGAMRAALTHTEMKLGMSHYSVVHLMN